MKKWEKLVTTSDMLAIIIILFFLTTPLSAVIAVKFAQAVGIENPKPLFDSIFKCTMFVLYLLVLYLIFRKPQACERKLYYQWFILFYIVLIAIGFFRSPIANLLKGYGSNCYHIFRISSYAILSLEKAIMVTIIYDTLKGISEVKEKIYEVKVMLETLETKTYIVKIKKIN